MVRKRQLTPPDAVYAEFRPGDIRHSQADLSRISHDLGYSPTRTVADGIGEAIGWYLAIDTPPRGQRRFSLDSSGPPSLSVIPPRDDA
jgi:dTDP-D-glucose 4,6-dehydratase